MIRTKDIRLLQIIFMGSILSAGVIKYDFSLTHVQILLTFLSGLFTQLFFKKRLNLDKSVFLSAIISCLGIVLLFRSNNIWAHPLIAAMAISSKYFIRMDNRHFFNPSALGIVIGILLIPGNWLSPGQWGFEYLLATVIVGLGCFFTTKVNSFSISWFFIIFYLGGLALRNWYLGYELEILFHRSLNGSLLLFSFFMISDPKTSPHHILGKVTQAFFVAALSLFIHYYLYINNGFIFALIISSPLVPILNGVWKKKSFEWSSHENHFSHSHRISFNKQRL